jgi:hypothetical protein
MVGILMGSNPTRTEVREIMEAHLGEPSEYMSEGAQQVPLEAVVIAIELERTGSLKHVRAIGPKMTVKAMLQFLDDCGFSFERLLRDQHEELGNVPKLCRIHGLGHKRVRQILSSTGVQLKRGKPAESVSDQKLLSSYYELDKNVSRVARRHKLHRTTVSRRLRPYL